jgi:putative Ca2+/H+ antiporter (TMEM165/GDT1 family)
MHYKKVRIDMGTAISIYLIAVGAVTLAEMGDKTQLLAMCFAARYKASKVLIGVFLATVLNHAIAVGAGYLLKEVLSKYSLYIQVVAALSFIGYGLWTIRGDTVDDACDSKSQYGPVATVAIAFFIAEMGDKTQFATISLAATYGNPLAVLLGTTTGMLIADGIGIIFGVVLNKKIPERTMKWISASIFTVCGLAGYIQALAGVMEMALLICTVLIIIVLTICIALWIVRKNNTDVYKEKII